METDGIRRIERLIARARWALGLERVWSALLWPLLICGLGASLVLSGLLPELPALARIATLGALLVAFAAAWWPARSLRQPSRAEAVRRIETVSHFDHRPLSAVNDRLAGEPTDRAAMALWQEHHLRQLTRLQDARAGTPRSDWQSRDPLALRVPVALLLVVSVLLGAGELGSNFRDTLQFAPSAPGTAISVDAWLKPPAYTGKPPVLLTSEAMRAALVADPEILVPENATLTIRATGLAKPGLAILPLDAQADAPPLSGIDAKQITDDGGFHAEAVVSRPLQVRLTDGNREIARWHIATIPDAPPTVGLRDVPVGDASGALTVKWQAADDYGVTGLTAEISLSDMQADGMGFAATGVFLFDPPKLAIKLRRANPRSEEGATTTDLTEHPWAGLMVDITLSASDAREQTGSSPVQSFRLPERMFLKPLARALIEQRKRLIMDPDNASDVSTLLKALLVYPEGLIDRSGAHIAIATVISRLDNASSTDDVGEAIKALWQIAVNVEEGSSADARAELESLRKQLERALAEGAPPGRIRQLTDKMREAMDRYLQALMDETRKELQKGGAADQQAGRPISPDELREMLDDIDKLSQSGANDAARQMLSQLEDILRNLKPQSGDSQQGQTGGEPMEKMLDRLTDMMRKQQGLMDDTQRMQPGEPAPDEGRGEPNQGNGSEPRSLGDRQRNLGEALSDLMKELGQLGLKGPPSLGEAGKNMGNAEKSLRQGDQQGALDQQGQAMGRLREGTRDMLRQMLQSGRGQSRMGGNSAGRGDDRDPLGRPRANRQEDYGPDRSILPSERAMRRAQEILDELRSRSNSGDRPRIERDYIDRLLRGLY
jgi:uncharacterized protein (TIGR02302 family)